MYRSGDNIIFDYKDVDHEDNRTYEYYGEMPIEEYRNAVQQLLKEGRASVENNDFDLCLSKEGESVHIRFSGTPSPASTPGGASLSGSINHTTTLDKILEMAK